MSDKQDVEQVNNRGDASNGVNGSSKKGPSPEDVAQAASLKDQGNQSFKSGDYDNAVSYYLQATELDPNQPSYHSNLAAAYMAQKNFQKAQAACIKSLEIYGSKRHEKEQQQSTTNTESTTVTESDSELQLAESKVLVRLSKCYLSLGDLKACQSTLNRLPSSNATTTTKQKSQPPLAGLEQIKSSLSRTSQHFQSSQSNLKSKNFTMSHIALDKAISEIESISSTSSSSSKSTIPLQWRILRSLIYLSQGKLDDASSTISDALRLNPNDPEALTTRGQVLLAKGDVAKALSHAQAALRSDPENKDARELLKRCKKLERAKEEGNAAFKGGDMEDAVQKYTSAIELSDSTSSPFSAYSIESPELKGFKATLFSNRATAYSKLNKHPNAISDCTSALELDPNYLKALRTRARSNLADEKYEDSVRDFKKAVEEGGDESIKRELRNAEIELKKSKKKDYYKILGVPRDASTADIKKAFRKESLIHHPDKGGDEEKFKLINESFGILSDDDKRRRFDAGQDDLESDNPFGGGMGGFGGEEVNLADLFGAGGMGGFPGGAFGGMGGMGGHPFGGGGSRRGPPPGFRFG